MRIRSGGSARLLAVPDSDHPSLHDGAEEFVDDERGLVVNGNWWYKIVAAGRGLAAP